MRAFIIRPFGTRKGINFDSVEQQLIAPALKAIGAEGATTAEIIEAGNIRIDMFQQLLVADLVVADISTNNPNAFYELGIRHALQEKRTFLIRAKTPPSPTLSEQEKKELEVSFDLKTDRYLEYDPAAPGNCLEQLTEALRLTAASERQDSPVFLLLPNLKSQNRDQFIPVPLGFGEEVQRAEKDHNAARLTLLGLEAIGFPWESTGLRVVGRALFLIQRFAAAKTTWESLRQLDDFDLEANIKLGNVYQRLDDLTGSDQALQRALQRAASPGDIAEIHGQLGRNNKDRWTRAWSKAEGAGKARIAFESPLLREAYQQYLMAYRQDLNTYYPGINALALAIIILELADRFPDAWLNQCDDSDDAARQLAEVKRTRDQLAGALQLRCDAAGKPDASAESKKDAWLISSAGDLSLLLSQDARRAIQWYKRAAASQDDFSFDSVRKQLMLFADLGVMQPRAGEALNALPPADAPRPSSALLECIVLFTGHRIDDPSRQHPRFPASMESVAREAIRAALQEQKNLTTGPMLGVAGGASGGDILFLELCDELSIPTHMMLALPDGQFVNASVESPGKTDGKTWVERFYAQLQRHPDAPVLAQTPELPKWLQFKRNYDIWQRNNLWLLSEALCYAPKHLTLIALWDGEPGDGPGGTQHMVDLAAGRGARIVHLDTKALFHLSDES